MPFCDISKDVSLHYVTNTPRGDVTDLDQAKPSILLLPPMLCDVTWLREQFRDRRLSGQYNLIAIDQRNSGKTRAPLMPERDTWVDAADLAVAHELLQLPPCHVFAVSLNGCGAALRLAMICPAKCLSLCLCAVPAGKDPEWVEQGYHDMVQGWCFPQDLDALERACLENLWFAFNGQISTELEDEFVAWAQVNLPPTRRTCFLAQALPATYRHRFTDKELASIQQPTLFIHGDKSLHNPPSTAQAISAKIPNSRVFVVKGGPELLTIVPEYASVTHRAYTQFLSDIPSPSAFQPSQPDPERVCRDALKRLADFVNEPSIAQRDPTTILSFSLFSAEQIEQNANMLAEFAKGEKEAFHALNKHGQPLRKFSERNLDQWTPAAFERYMAAGTGIITVVESSSVSV